MTKHKLFKMLIIYSIIMTSIKIIRRNI